MGHIYFAFYLFQLVERWAAQLSLPNDRKTPHTTPLNRDGGASTPIPRAHAASQPVPPIDVSQSFINRVLSAVQLRALLRVACLILPSSFFCSCSIGRKIGQKKRNQQLWQQRERWKRRNRVSIFCQADQIKKGYSSRVEYLSFSFSLFLLLFVSSKTETFWRILLAPSLVKKSWWLCDDIITAQEVVGFDGHGKNKTSILSWTQL